MTPSRDTLQWCRILTPGSSAATHRDAPWSSPPPNQRLGKALAANKSVSTTLLHVGSRCVLNATVIDLRTEASGRAASVETTCGEDALLDGVKAVVRKLRKANKPN